MTYLNSITYKFTIAALAAILLFAPQVSSAQISTGDRAIEISPFLIDLDVAPGGEVVVQITVKNNSAASTVIRVEPKDFLPGEDGQPNFVPDEQINDKTFSLASWVQSLSGTEIAFGAGETKVLDFRITPPADAEINSHYGAILFSSSSTEPNSGSGVTQAVGTLLLLDYGQAMQEGYVILDRTPTFNFSSEPFTFETTFHNTGRSHLQPKGEVYIKNIFGKLVATDFINRDAAYVLPQTTRSFSSVWQPEKWKVGAYIATSEVYYGNPKQLVVDEAVIVLLPWQIVTPIIIIILILIWLITVGRKKYRRRVIAQTKI